MAMKEPTANPLMDIVFRFADTQLITTAIELGLFTKLLDKKRNIEKKKD